MTDIEHAKKYAEESISLAISMYNPKAEIIAETACLYGLTYKNDQLTKAKELLKQWLQTSKASGCDNINIVTDTEQFLKDSKQEG